MKKATENLLPEMHDPILLRAINILLRRLKIFFLIFFLSLLFAWLFIALQIPVYQAVTTIELPQSGTQSQTSDDVVEILQSRSLAHQVVQRMNLDWQIASLSPGLDVKIGRFSISRNISGLRIVLEEPPAYKVSDLSGRFVGSGRSGEPFRTSEIDLLLDVRKGQTGQQLTLEYLPNDAHVEALLANLSVVPSQGDGNIVKIISYGSDPEHTRDIANVLVETYRAQLSAQADRSLRATDRQVDEAQDAFAAVSKEHREYAQKRGLDEFPSDTVTLADNITRLEQNRSQLTARRQRVDRAQSQLRQALSDGSTFLPPPFEEFPHISEMSSGLAELRAREKALLIEYTSAYPEVIEVQDAIRNAQKVLLARYAAVANNLDAEIAGLDDQITQSMALTDSLTEAELHRMELSRTTHMDILASLQQQQHSLQLRQALVAEQVRVVDPAVTPRSPIKPEKGKILAVGGAIGILLGFLTVLLLSATDRRFNTVAEVQAKLKLPIYGVIPRIPAVDVGQGIPVAVQLPKAPVVEAFRALRTRLHAVTSREKHKIILVTSSLPGEGKSTLSTNLAVVLAQTGAKILLIGCDLRRPSLHQMFGQTNVPGLVDLLSEGMQDAVRHIASPRIDFLPAGTIPMNPSEILASGRMRNFLETVRSRYDYVVIDAPPVLPVTDAQILSPLADITLAVLEPCRVPEKAALQMVESLQSVGATISGMVINDRMGRGFKYYGSYSYYGNKNYSGYYGENPDDLVDGPMIRTARKIWEKLNY